MGERHGSVSKKPLKSGASTETARWGPLLKSRLTGDTTPYKELMDNNQLADPNTGVAYFKNFLRPYFLKGAYNTFLYRMISFINLRKGRRDMPSFMTQFDIPSRRLAAAWVELMRPPERDAEFHASLATENVRLQTEYNQAMVDYNTRMQNPLDPPCSA